MIFNGRSLSVTALWGALGVEVPASDAGLPTYLPLVHCPNPGHDTKKRHFQINTVKPWVHCHARCGIEGTYEHAICVILGLYSKHGLDGVTMDQIKEKREPGDPIRTKVNAAHYEARRMMMDHTRITLDLTEAIGTRLGHRKALTHDSAVANDQTKLETGAFQFLPKPAREYLEGRGLSPSTRGKWQLGWCEEEERIVIPAFDEHNRFRFLIKRRIDGKQFQKYLYTEGAIKTSLLFGACMLDPEQVRSHGIVLCEGSLDAIRLHQFGVTNAVAILGTGLSERQVRIIDRMRPAKIYTFFDKDSSGASNTLDAAKKLTKLPVRVCLFPRGVDDPASLTADQALSSVQMSIPFQAFINRARSMQTARR